VSERTIREWLSRIDKDTKEARKKRIFELWLAGWTQEEIAAAVGVERATLSTDKSFAEIGNVAKLSKTEQAAAEHATDFTIPVYNEPRQLSVFGSSNSPPHVAHRIRCQERSKPYSMTEESRGTLPSLERPRARSGEQGASIHRLLERTWAPDATTSRHVIRRRQTL
jgi:transcriptional regulator with XRE-family HTH domain